MGGWWASVQQRRWRKRSGERVTWLPASCWECGPAAGLLPVWSCQEIGGRKEEKEREEHRQVRERWSVVVPEEEAGMTQAPGLCNQKGRERQRHRGRRKRGRGRGRHAGDRGEREHTHFCNLIRESSRLLPSASKGYRYVYTHARTHTKNKKAYNCMQRKKHRM